MPLGHTPRSLLSAWATALAFFAAAPLLGPSLARADGASEPAAVLSITSEDGDDDFAVQATSALRSAVAQVGSYNLDPRELSLSQMMLAQGCTDADAACLGKIAAMLNVRHVFFGVVERTDAASPAMLLRLSLFSVANQRVERTVEDTFPVSGPERDTLPERTVRYVADLSGMALEGMLRVRVNVPGAAVRIDGRDVGVADSSGAFEAKAEAGDHQLEVVAQNHAPYRQKVSVIANHGATVEVFLQSGDSAPGLGEPGASSGSLAWLGWTLVGVGVAGAALTVTSSVIISGLDDDATFSEYRSAVPKGKDACTEADASKVYGGLTKGEVGDVRDTCSQASLFEALWWVGLGVGVAAGGAGLFVLLTDDGDETDGGESDVAKVQLVPHVSRTDAMLTARFRF